MLVRKRQLKAIGCCFALVWLVANAIYLWTLLRPDEVADGQEEQPLASQPEVGTARTPSESGGALPDPPRGCPQSWHSIHAFYFDGWGTPSVDGRWIGWNDSRSPHWDAHRISQYSLEGHSPPLDLASDFYPESGPYSSAHDGTLRRHMEHARWACIGALILPFGDSEAEGILDRVEALRRIFAAAETSGVKIGFQIQAYERRSAQSVCRDIRFLYARFGHLAAFMARPVVYVYDSYFLDDAELALCFAALRSEYTDYWILVGLIVNEADIDKAQRATFDGVFTFFATYTFTYATQISRWHTIDGRCKAAGLLFVPTVAPGHSDLQLRPWNQENLVERKTGAYYRKMWEAAINVAPAFVTINSFNHWHDGTQIEPALTPPSTRLNASARTYLDYDDGHGSQAAASMYLAYTQELVSKCVARNGCHNSPLLQFATRR